MSSSQNPLTAVPARKWRWPLLFLLLILLPLLACSIWWGVTAAYHQQTFHPTGRILFECSPDPTTSSVRASRLCAVNADGSTYTSFGFKLPYSYSSLSWSPDGKSIAFTRDFGLSLVKADGSGLIDVTDQYGSTRTPAWSPDGKVLAFAKFDDSGKADGIYTVQVDGSNLKQLSGFGAGPVWSPDGKRIAFTNNEEDGIYILSLDTGYQIQIANGISAKWLAWSPNGLQIAFSTYIYTHPGQILTGLGLMNIDGSNRKEFQGKFSSPAWSPDGTKIGYKCDFAVCTMNADGSEKTRLAQNGLIFQVLGSVDIPSFSWSPDGQYIIYSLPILCPTCPSSAELWIMKADGSQPTKLTEGPYDRNPVWRSAP